MHLSSSYRQSNYDCITGKTTKISPDSSLVLSWLSAVWDAGENAIIQEKCGHALLKNTLKMKCYLKAESSGMTSHPQSISFASGYSWSWIQLLPLLFFCSFQDLSLLMVFIFRKSLEKHWCNGTFSQNAHLQRIYDTITILWCSTTN